MSASGHLPGPEHRDQLLETYLYVQRELEDKGVLPAEPEDLLSGHRDFWQAAGAIHLGLLVASLTVFGMFVVLNMVFHVEF